MRVLLIAALLCAALLSLAGCGYARYYMERPDGTKVSIITSRQFEDGILVKHQSAEGAKLEVDAGSVSSGASPTESVLVAALLRGLGLPVPPVAPAEPSGQ